MKVSWNSKYTTISVYSVITFAVCLALVQIAINAAKIFGVIGTIFSVLSPIVWGLVIAYLLNPVMMALEKGCKRLFEKKKPHPKLVRGISTALSVLFGIVLVYALVAVIFSQVLDSIMNIFNNASTYMNNIYDMVNKYLAQYPELVDYINTQLDSIRATVMSTVNDLIPKVGDWALKIKDGAMGILVAVKDFVIGFIVAVYLLLDKEKFIAQSKKLLTALLPKKWDNGFFGLCSHTNKMFSGFISGKILDSFIIGMLCFIIMRIMNMEYTVLISTIVGVTNIIPFFGPFIGAIPSALLLLISAPSQTWKFIVLIIVLQQFDGNILGPKILGDSTGLPAFWVMFAIFLGGGLFGFSGMLLGVPVFAVIYTLIGDLVEFLLTQKGMSTDTSDYLPAPPEESPKKSPSAAQQKKAG